MQPPLSLWWSQVGDASPRASLRGDVDVDVVIVGGGYTGLWTARELRRRDPNVRVAVVEAQVCGFGASGRNGGWVSALFPVSASTVVDHYGLDAYTRLRLLLQDAVPALGRAAAADGIDCDFAQGGTLSFARTALQEVRARHYVATARSHAVPEEDLRWIEGAELREIARVDEARGAAFSPHCARIQPARLARGLARAVEALGVNVFENTRVARIVPGDESHRPHVVTAHGTVHADFVVRATEGFTPTLARQRRSVVPLYSLMIATEPLPGSWWRDYGFANYPTFNDERHLLIYGQRTADDRLAFGGRGSPYHFGSTVEPRFDAHPGVFAQLDASLRELFPTLDAAITHRWGGPLAMPRSKFPLVTVDHRSGLCAAGGYTGDGVTLSYVCANALADLITAPHESTPFTSLPFVQTPPRNWEFEPLRWLGINTGLALATWADHHERRQGRESRASAMLNRLMGE
jgi:glycine/D-amino acid oxidase-like deaminating enzyme